jgi:hypothetical protein
MRDWLRGWEMEIGELSVGGFGVNKGEREMVGKDSGNIID